MIKNKLMVLISLLGGFMSQLYGGWTTAMTTLLTFMVIDYVTGFLVAAFWKKSNKSKTGRLNSSAGTKGIIKKGIIFLVVYMAVRLDIMFGSTAIKDVTVIAFICNESVSIIENLGLMGVYIPKPIKNCIEVLKEKEGEA